MVGIVIFKKLQCYSHELLWLRYIDKEAMWPASFWKYCLRKQKIADSM
ncbi:MAG: hypothetical protein JETT_3816 [Candidatus Jettenia ecosi]|uniref:Uncharacterized protein n=1 Tax=Candidatus Jettenia ecosi TaxID=2494326 RepID=A0A533Q5U1_9BACT|nr:MAG: hypothetical protein JETT_3816 [Candidatus Jettenia ecosi]